MEITVIVKQSGAYWTAAAFIDGAFAGCAVCADKEQAKAQARVGAEYLVQHGQLTPLSSAEAARLGGRAKVGHFGAHVRLREQPRAIMMAAQLAALAAPFLPADEASAAVAAAA